MASKPLLTYQKAPSVSEDTTEALAAVERLSTLFADVTINELEQVLDDPMLELANIEGSLADSGSCVGWADGGVI